MDSPLYSVASSSQRVACGGFVGELAAVVVDDEQELIDMLTGILADINRYMGAGYNLCF